MPKSFCSDQADLETSNYWQQAVFRSRLPETLRVLKIVKCSDTNLEKISNYQTWLKADWKKFDWWGRPSVLCHAGIVVFALLRWFSFVWFSFFSISCKQDALGGCSLCVGVFLKFLFARTYRHQIRLVSLLRTEDGVGMVSGVFLKGKKQ